jgi:signal transduction histidine kinase
MVIVNTDTSLRRISEAHLAKRERLEGVASLAEGISHDLPDRIAPLLLAAQSVGEKNLDEQAKKLVQVMSQKARQLDDLSRQVAAVSLRPDETAGALPQGKAQLVMIFDPDLTVRTMLQTVIEANGYRAIPADDADQGIAFLAQYGERIKLVLFRPDMTDGEKTPLGVALAALGSPVPLVATEDPAKSGAPQGSRPLAGVLHRPFSTPLLLRMLAEVLG